MKPKDLNEFDLRIQKAYEDGRAKGVDVGRKQADDAIHTFCERLGLDRRAFNHLADKRRTLGTLEQAELYCWKFQVKKMNAMVGAREEQ